MRVIAAISADFEQTTLGTSARLEADLRGETVLRRTLRRVLQTRGLAGVHLVVPAAQAERAARAAAGLAVRIETHDAAPVPWGAYVRSARKWSLDAWRGGLSGASVFDESLDPWVLDGLVRREAADGIVDVPAASCLLDPALLDAMIEHYEGVYQEVRMTFTQSAPGLSAAIYAPSLLADLVKAVQPIGRTMAFNPADIRKDMIMLPCFYPPHSDVRQAFGRCLADTGTACDRVARILDHAAARGGEDELDALRISQWLLEHRLHECGDLPAEVEIELTTEDPLPGSTLRPRGSAVERRGPMDEGLFARLVAELAGRDDLRVVLGGFGDPLMHPQWPRCVRLCREAGVFALAVRTPAVHLDDAALSTLLDARVDVLNVLLDAATAETYRRVHQADYFDRVLANMDRLIEAHRKRGQPQPLVVCEMMKTHATMDEIEVFYDHWLRKTGTAVLAGPSDYAGEWPDLAVMNMAPPSRTPCERLHARASVLADGRVLLCDQDYNGRHAIGSLADASLSALWTGPAMTAARQAHAAGRYDTLPLCPVCREWHRP